MTETLTLRDLIREKRIIVCCGAGGVGKTTTSASIGLAAARLGRRVLVLTIDPSKRLAETLGVERNPSDPVPIAPALLSAAGVGGGGASGAAGSVDAWMLDPKLIADRAIRRLIPNPEQAERFLKNRIYAHVTSMVATMQEYTAMEALHRFVIEGKYDLIVLDTPPSRHALDFLEAPGRVARFLEGRIFRMFMPKEGGVLRRATSSLMNKVLTATFGEEFAGDLSLFLGSFAGVFNTLGADVSEMRRFLCAPDVAFLLVTSPAPVALRETVFFQDKTRELSLPFRGFILNRSMAGVEKLPQPTSSLLCSDDVLAKLREFAAQELEQSEKHRALLDDLRQRGGPRTVAVALPALNGGASDMRTLGVLSSAMLES